MKKLLIILLFSTFLQSCSYTIVDRGLLTPKVDSLFKASVNDTTKSNIKIRSFSNYYLIIEK